MEFKELFALLTQFLKKNCDSFLWIGFNCFKVAEPLLGDSLHLTTNFPRVPVIHFIELRQMKG